MEQSWFPLLSENKVVEYTLDGKEIWSVNAKSPWSAIRLHNGNTLISGDWSKYTREVNMKGETVWELTQADVPFTLYNNQTANRLANGNTVISNWCAGNPKPEEWKGTVQVFEVTPDKKVVWALSSWENPDFSRIHIFNFSMSQVILIMENFKGKKLKMEYNSK